ncbi:hypothetical protein GCM10009760_08830 [Kitasatospora kazusensis]|uniref:Peptidase M48 domain-containing protein n=1 Tax=Kitasatospora kazusensis TaxID=407974 RepID=A0ABN2YVG5_9ACTN
MITVLALGVFLALVGRAAPKPLARAAWVVRAPRLAVAAWVALLAAAAMGAAMTVHQLLTPHAHRPFGLARWLTGLGDVPPAGAGGHVEPVLLALAVFCAAAGVVGAGWVRAGRARVRHRAVLDLVGRPAGDGPWLVVEDTRAAAWCVPGRGGRIVFTRGALDRLTPGHRAAVLAHERAHLAGRHHLLVAGAVALGRALPWFPPARLAAEQVPVLLEMAADDAALRVTTPQVLAEALCAVAAGPAPGGALAAGGHAVVARVKRLLVAGPGLRAVQRGAGWAVVVLLPTVPVLLGCGP